MDELIIEEKRYLSSKRAAQITGYAKDYIGQLCREGRVPARLVGRGWYVLESAIQDHRFGNEGINQQRVKTHVKLASKSISEPKYESVTSKELPIFFKKTTEEQISPESNLQSAWQAWFDHLAQTKEPEPESVQAVSERISGPEKQEVMGGGMGDSAKEGTTVKIKAIYQGALKAPEKKLEERMAEVFKAFEEAEDTQKRERHTHIKIKNPLFTYIRIAGGVFAVVALTFAVLGTGYFDNLIISTRQAQFVAGVILYNK